jgi:hypothetical protein
MKRVNCANRLVAKCRADRRFHATTSGIGLRVSPLGDRLGKNPLPCCEGYHHCPFHTSFAMPITGRKDCRPIGRCCKLRPFEWVPRNCWGGGTRLAAIRIGSKRWRRFSTWFGSRLPWPPFGSGDSAGGLRAQSLVMASGCNRPPWSASWRFSSRLFPLPTTCTLKPPL